MDEWTLNDLLECSVCLERLDTSSKVLPCQHTFCKKCLEEIVTTHKELRCPECRILVEAKIDELPPNVLLMRILEGMRNAAPKKRNSGGSASMTAAPPVSNRLMTVGQHLPSPPHQQHHHHHPHHQQPASLTPGINQPCARAVYDYLSKMPGDLSFKEGDLIILRRKIDNNWYHGECRGNMGVFPLSYVQIMTPLPSHIPQCKALYDFRMSNDDEEGCLTFNKGDVVTVIRRVDENWAEGKLGDRIGIFPLAFVELNNVARALMKLSINCQPGPSRLAPPTPTTEDSTPLIPTDHSRTVSTIAPSSLTTAPATGDSGHHQSVTMTTTAASAVTTAAVSSTTVTTTSTIITTINNSNTIQHSMASDGGSSSTTLTSPSSSSTSSTSSSSSSSTTPPTSSSSSSTAPSSPSSPVGAQIVPGPPTGAHHPQPPPPHLPPPAQHHHQHHGNSTNAKRHSFTILQQQQQRQHQHHFQQQSSSHSAHNNRHSAEILTSNEDTSTHNGASSGPSSLGMVNCCLSTGNTPVHHHPPHSHPHHSSHQQGVGGGSSVPANNNNNGGGGEQQILLQRSGSQRRHHQRSSSADTHPQQPPPPPPPHPSHPSSAASNTSTTSTGAPPPGGHSFPHATLMLPASYVALYPYKPQKSDELELKRGSVYTVTERCQDGWFKGTNKHQKCGVFPGNYVAPSRSLPALQAQLRGLGRSGIVGGSARSSPPSSIPSPEPRTYTRPSSNSTGIPSSNRHLLMPSAGNVVGGGSNNPPELPPRSISPGAISTSWHSGDGSATSRSHSTPTHMSSSAGSSQHHTLVDSTSAVGRSSPVAVSTAVNAPPNVSVSLVSTTSGKSTEKVKSGLMRIFSMKKSPTPPASYLMDNPVFEDSTTSSPPIPSSAANSPSSQSQQQQQQQQHLQTPVHVRSGSCPSQLLQVIPPPGSGGGDVTITSSPHHHHRLFSPSTSQRIKHKERANFNVAHFSRIVGEASSPIPHSAAAHHRKSNSLDAGALVGVSSDTRKTKQLVPVVKERFRCIVPYPPNSEYELELQVGDVIYVHKKREDGWYKGTQQRTGRTGLFPASFVETF